MTHKFFNATDIQIGFCKNTDCRGVHIHLLDPEGAVRAQAVIACHGIDQLITDLQMVRDRIVGTAVSLERH